MHDEETSSDKFARQAKCWEECDSEEDDEFSQRGSKKESKVKSTEEVEKRRAMKMKIYCPVRRGKMSQERAKEGA